MSYVSMLASLITPFLFYLVHAGWVLGLFLIVLYDKGVIGSYDALFPSWVVLSMAGSFVLAYLGEVKRPLLPIQ